MLFLGAGASTQFKIGDIEDLTEKIVNETEGDLRKTINKIKTILNKSKNREPIFGFNLEVLYSILDAIANRWQILNELGPFPVLMNNLLDNSKAFKNLEVTKQDLNLFKRIVERVIVRSINSYNNNNEMREKAREQYDKLFNIPIKYDHQFKDSQNNDVSNVFNTVATLNYDLVLELYDVDSDNENVDRLATTLHFFNRRGFDDEKPSKLNLRKILKHDFHSNERIDYIKLHGSMDWWKDTKDNIIQDFSGNNPIVKLKNRNIIYPVYEKSVSREPFFTLYQYFRRTLLDESIVIIIGYSFGDISINNAFIDWLSFNRKARLVIVSRKKNHRRIRKIFGNLQDRVEFIMEYFGEPNFIQNLGDLLISPPNP
jgi:hypothetical protein